MALNIDLLGDDLQSLGNLFSDSYEPMITGTQLLCFGDIMEDIDSRDAVIDRFATAFLSSVLFNGNRPGLDHFSICSCFCFFKEALLVFAGLFLAATSEFLVQQEAVFFFEVIVADFQGLVASLNRLALRFSLILAGSRLVKLRLQSFYV